MQRAAEGALTEMASLTELIEQADRVEAATAVEVAGAMAAATHLRCATAVQRATQRQRLAEWRAAELEREAAGVWDECVVVGRWLGEVVDSGVSGVRQHR